jgi:hypothetical protein
MFKRFWSDESGAVLSFELMLLLTTVVIGSSVGMVVLRDATVAELQRAAAAINALDPGYMISGLVYISANNGSAAVVNSTNASDMTLGIGPGSGQILNSVVGSGNISFAPDFTQPTIIVSP